MKPAIAQPLPLVTILPSRGRVPDRRERSLRAQPKQRFKLVEFVNPRTGSHSWRVAGIKRTGDRVRENFADSEAARCRQVELEGEYLGRASEDTVLRATRLTDTQLKIAEAAFPRLDADDELLSAVDYWVRHGRQQSVKETVRLDEAVTQFKAWLETTESMRDLSKRNIRIRVDIFANSVGNVPVNAITPEFIEAFLAKRGNKSAATRDNDRRAVSRFIAWCMERPRRWIASNPCAQVRVELGEKAPPAVLTVQECEKLLRAAERFEKGKLAVYVAVTMFAGLRPFEASRLKWSAVNLKDGELRLESNETKTGTARVVTICPTLKKWLTAYRGREFFPSNWRKDFDQVKTSAGFGKGEKLKAWTVDVLRHTAISHYFRETGSYGQTAEQFGNSEQVIKAHYQGRVSSADTKRFYALAPKGKAGR